jgi:hypothetical protein
MMDVTVDVLATPVPEIFCNLGDIFNPQISGKNIYGCSAY